MDTALFKSKPFIVVAATVGAVILLLLAFNIGEKVGFHKASFSYRMGDNYHRNFVGPQEGMHGMLFGDFSGAHGVEGKIISINLPTVVIEGSDAIEKQIIVSGTTGVHQFRDEISASDLKIDDFVVVLGEPTDKGQIDARFIRVLPPPPLPVSSSEAPQSSQIK